MERTIRYFLYLIIGCMALLLFFMRYFYGSPANSASAFEWEKTVSVYFGNSEKGSAEDCAKVFALSRPVLNAETLGPGAAEALLRGLTEAESKSGYFSSINSGVLLQKFEVKNGTAYVDFNSKFNENVAGSCKVTAIKSQIENTLNSLPDIDSVVISVNGQTEGILEP